MRPATAPLLLPFLSMFVQLDQREGISSPFDDAASRRKNIHFSHKKIILASTVNDLLKSLWELKVNQLLVSKKLEELFTYGEHQSIDFHGLKTVVR